MVSEAIRHWEEDEIKNEGEAVDPEYGTFDHAACLGAENAPNDIRNKISLIFTKEIWNSKIEYHSFVCTQLCNL